MLLISGSGHTEALKRHEIHHITNLITLHYRQIWEGYCEIRVGYCEIRVGYCEIRVGYCEIRQGY